MSDIASRFTGPHGARLLTETFGRQRMVGGVKSVASRLARACQLEVWDAGQAIIEQGGTDNDLYLILLGSVVIERNNRPGPVRSAGDHFGELALIDVHQRRNATVRTREATVTARIAEPDFTRIASRHPHLWRELAIEISRRLAQRLQDVIPRNERPSVFIGSSREALPIAECIRDGIAGDRDVRIWSEGVFGASDTTIESLEDVVRSADFGILIMSPDDETISRGVSSPAPRDNVVFELGLFIGAVGRRRSFIVRPTGPIKVMSDLLGVTPVFYSDDSSIDLKSRLEPACAELVAAIERLGPK
jgi:CRP/FNR family transcriptional regulator, cyclic AMP receptor protein